MESIQRNIALKRVWLSLAAALALMTAGMFSTAMAVDEKQSVERHMVTIFDGSTEQTIITRADTVGDALKQAGVSVGQRDLVEPAISEELIAEHYNVNVYRARPVIVEDGAARVRTVTAAQSPAKIAASANVTLYDEDDTKLKRVDDVVSDGGAGLKMTIDRATPFTFTLYGKLLENTRTQGETVGDMLKEKNVKLGKNDGVSVPLETPLVAGMSVSVWRNGVQTMTQEEAIAMPVEQIKDQDRPAGFKEVRSVGKPGKKQVTYEINMQNGVEVSRKVIQSVETLAPLKQVEVIGAKSVYSGGPLSEAQINFLGSCESGMTATRNSGNGFYGAFQFMPSTWRTVAPAPYNGVMPHEAPLDAQKQAVQNLLSRSSIFTQFPGCAKKMQAAGVI